MQLRPTSWQPGCACRGRNTNRAHLITRGERPRHSRSAQVAACEICSAAAFRSCLPAVRGWRMLEGMSKLGTIALVIALGGLDVSQAWAGPTARFGLTAGFDGSVPE